MKKKTPGNRVTTLISPNRSIRSPEKAKLFLEKVLEGAAHAECAAHAGIGETTAYEWRRDDPKFAEAWAEAQKIGDAKRLETYRAEAERRAIKGIPKGIYHLGRQVAVEQQYSDVLLMFLTKKMDPSYRENSQIDVNLNVNIAAELKKARERAKQS